MLWLLLFQLTVIQRKQLLLFSLKCIRITKYLIIISLVFLYLQFCSFSYKYATQLLTKLGVVIQGGHAVKQGGLEVIKVQFEESTRSLASTGKQQHRGSIYADQRFIPSQKTMLSTAIFRPK